MKPLKPLDVKTSKDVVKLIRTARKAEKAGQLDVRDTLAHQVFTTPNARLMTDGTKVVDTFWDIKTRSFITQIRVGGKQTVPSVFSRKESAPVSHLWALYSFMQRGL